jgi:hypothetical protein
MARVARTAAEVPLGRIAEALRKLPAQAKTWARASQRQAWAEFQQNPEFPGMRARFNQASHSHDLRRGKEPRRGLRSYGFAARTDRKRGWHAYRDSGAMESELMARKIRIRVSAGAVIGRMSLHARVTPLLAAHRGAVSARRVTEAVTYGMTVYRDSKRKLDPRIMTVTRNVSRWHYTASPRTYAQEWEWRAAELVWIRRRTERALRERVRRSAFDKNGNIRSKYANQFNGAAA